MTEQEQFYGFVNRRINGFRIAIKISFVLSFWLTLWLFFPFTFYPSIATFAFYYGYKFWKWGNNEDE
jgi:hypothetical protein